MMPRRILLPVLAAVLVLAGAAWHLGLPGSGGTTPAEKEQKSLAVSSSQASARSAEPIQPLPEPPALDGDKVALGKRLFHDPRLSGDSHSSCASCHALDRGGVGGTWTGINTPSVLTAALNYRQYWDGRAPNLEAQAQESISSPREMASDWSRVMDRLEADAELGEAFRRAYRDGITPANVANAIAEFEKSLPRPSRFDRWLKGDRTAISADELAGYQLFKKHGCIGCHQGANVGGNLMQSFGIMAQYFNGTGDAGRSGASPQEEDRNLLKVPSLRNVALTAPYFHDGSIDRLEDAVAIMGHYQLGINLPPRDIVLIVVFLQSLTSEAKP